MEIRLSPELEAVVERDMASGRFRSVEDYIAEAVELLHERELWRGETLEEENAKLAASIAEAERGELMDEDQVRQEMREMKAEWAKAHPAA
jgi:Arc/MetJ-type ribon-helix-helix transcriptional regulator